MTSLHLVTTDAKPAAESLETLLAGLDPDLAAKLEAAIGDVVEFAQNLGRDVAATATENAVITAYQAGLRHARASDWRIFQKYGYITDPGQAVEPTTLHAVGGALR